MKGFVSKLCLASVLQSVFGADRNKFNVKEKKTQFSVSTGRCS